jgi:hypothetical protein
MHAVWLFSLDFPPMSYTRPQIHLGRGPARDILVDHPTVARHHATLEILPEGLFLRAIEAPEPALGGPPVAPVQSRLLDPHEEWAIGPVRFRSRLMPPPEASPEELTQARSSEDPALLTSLAARGGDLLRAVACNPRAPASLLARCAAIWDAACQRGAAANPATPGASLLSLALRFPAEFWSNSQVDFLLLEDPSFSALSAFSSYDLCSLLASPAIPEAHLHLFAAHPTEVVREFALRALSLRSVV